MTKAAIKTELIYLPPDALLTHPRNLRRFYPEHQIKEMAESIRSKGGVIQSLIIIPNGQTGKYYVIDGNVRHKGGKFLGKECPPLKCEVVSKSKAEQLLDMLITAKFRYDPDPISEALHYKRLIDEEHYSLNKIAKATGIHINTIKNRLKLLELDPEIQDIIACHKLPSDTRAIEAFLAIPNAMARVKLAQRLARDGVTVKSIIASCMRLVARMKEMSVEKIKGSPAIAIAKQRSLGKIVNPAATVKWHKVRDAAKEMCEACDIKLSLMKAAAEPAWSLVTHAAEETCLHCNVREIKGSCNECPGVDIIRRLILSI